MNERISEWTERTNERMAINAQLLTSRLLQLPERIFLNSTLPTVINFSFRKFVCLRWSLYFSAVTSIGVVFELWIVFFRLGSCLLYVRIRIVSCVKYCRFSDVYWTPNRPTMDQRFQAHIGFDFEGQGCGL